MDDFRLSGRHLVCLTVSFVDDLAVAVHCWLGHKLRILSSDHHTNKEANDSTVRNSIGPPDAERYDKRLRIVFPQPLAQYSHRLNDAVAIHVASIVDDWSDACDVPLCIDPHEGR
jgi:hypothetical protein